MSVQVQAGVAPAADLTKRSGHDRRMPDEHTLRLLDELALIDAWPAKRDRALGGKSWGAWMDLSVDEQKARCEAVESVEERRADILPMLFTMRDEAADELERPGVSERNRLWERERILAALAEPIEQRKARETAQAAHQHRANQHWAKTIGMDPDKEWTKEEVIAESQRQRAVFDAEQEMEAERMREELDALLDAERDARTEIVALMVGEDSLMDGLGTSTFREVEEREFRAQEWELRRASAALKSETAAADKANLARRLGVVVPDAHKPDSQHVRHRGKEIVAEIRQKFVELHGGERLVTPDDWMPPGSEDGPERIWAARPELQHVMNVAKTMKLSPWALLGQALTRAAASIPYWVHFKSFMGKRPVNLLVAVAGSTGTGKTAAESAVADVFRWPKDLGNVLEAGSGEAIPSAYAFTAAKADSETGVQKGDLVWRHEDHLARFGFDEVGRLNAVQGRQGATVLEYLKSAESGAALGRILASGEGVQLPAKEYRFTATINVQPERAHLITSADEAAGGLPGRMLWVSAEYAPFVGMRRRREAIDPYPLAHLNWTVIDTIDALPVMEDAFEVQQDAALAGELDPMESHGALLRAKVACCLMALAGRQSLIEGDWDLAGDILDNSRTIRRDVLKSVVEDKDDLSVGGMVKAARVMSTMAEHRSHGLTVGAARKKLSSRDRRVWDDAVARGAAEPW